MDWRWLRLMRRWGLLLVMEKAAQAGVEEELEEAMAERQGDLGAETATTMAGAGAVAQEVGSEHQEGGLVAWAGGAEGAGEQGEGLLGSC